MYPLNIFSTIKNMAIKEVKAVIYKNYFRPIGFVKESSYYSMTHQKKSDLILLATKLIEKLSDRTNTKQYLIMLNTKLLKRLKTINYQPKTLENPNIVDIKLFNIDQPKTSGKFSKTIRQAENVSEVSSRKSSNNPLNSETKESENCLNEKYV